MDDLGFGGVRVWGCLPVVRRESLLLHSLIHNVERPAREHRVGTSTLGGATQTSSGSFQPQTRDTLQGPAVGTHHNL